MTFVCLAEADLQQLHQVQLEMLREFDRVCRQLGLAYQLAAGSLLGAVRHGGFIPWDDDIDVVMLRADYQRFLRQAPALLDRRFFLQTWRSDPEFPYFFAKLRRNNSLYRENSLEASQHHHGIYLDIFPFDPVQPDRSWWCGLLAVLRALGRLGTLAHHPRGGRLAPWRPGWQRRLGPLAYRFLVAVPPVAWKLLYAGLLRCLALYPSTEVVCLVSDRALEANRWKQLVRPIREFQCTVELPFEDGLFPATADYHKALTRLYGDYMVWPPRERRIPKHRVLEFRLPEPDRSPLH